MKAVFVKHGPGEARCACCDARIPAAVETWPGRRGLFFCDRAECQDAAKSQPNCCYIGENEKPCSASGCSNFAPAGPYDVRHKDFVCSVKCWKALRARRAIGDTPMVCACGCGREFRAGKAKRQNYFFSRACAGRFKTAQVWARFGPHEPTFREYYEGFAQRHYRDAKFIVPLLSYFAEFLNERNVTDLATVTPKVITEFLSWGVKTGRKAIAGSISVISVFYNWMIAEGRSKLVNPVVPGIHGKKSSPSDPRPFTNEELAEAWAILDKRGTTRIRLAMALGEEAGLRISEIANVRLSDVDAKKQRVHVRPGKTGRARDSHFGDKTKKYLKLWLKERNPECEHDHLLHVAFGYPSTPQSLRDEFWRVLTKRGSTYHNGKRTNPDGFERWSTHRLRHTMACRLHDGGATDAIIQAQGGWSSGKALGFYRRFNPDVIERGFHAAMRRAKERELQNTPESRMSLSEYVNQRKSKK